MGRFTALAASIAYAKDSKLPSNRSAINNNFAIKPDIPGKEERYGLLMASNAALLKLKGAPKAAAKHKT